MPTIHQPASPGRDYVVPAPRVTDAIGAALRGAYGGDRSLPSMPADLLRALDRIGRG